jgi:hypothetical protein
MEMPTPARTNYDNGPIYGVEFFAQSKEEECLYAALSLSILSAERLAIMERRTYVRKK